MGFADVAHHHITPTSGYCFICPTQEFALPFQYRNTDLAFNIVRMNGKFLARLEIEIDDFEIGRVMDQKSLEGFLAEISLFKKVRFFHERTSPQYGIRKVPSLILKERIFTIPYSWGRQ